MAGRGRKRAKNGEQGEASTSSENTNEPKKKARKFNPYWRARGSYNRNSYQQTEKPVAVPITNGVENLDDFDLHEVSAVQVLKIDNLGNKNYPYWKLYFPKLEYEQNLDVVSHFKAFESFFTRILSKHINQITEIIEDRSIRISYVKLIENSEFLDEFKDFEDTLKNRPTQTLAAAGMAIHHVVESHLKDEDVVKTNLQTFRINLFDYQPVLSFTKLTMLKVNTLITIRGAVMRVSDSKIHSFWQVYQCQVCKTEQLVQQTNGKTTPLNFCSKKGCRTKTKFELLRNSPCRVYEAWQQIRVQESIYSSEKSNSNIGVRYIDVLLKNDLVDKVYIGDDIIVTGVLVLEDTNTKVYGQKPSYTSIGIKQFIDAVSVITVNSAYSVQRLALTDKDMRAIALIKQQPSVFRLLVNSLLQTMIGQEMEKAGLVLSLFGGSIKEDDEFIRENIHVLMVGDPGIGKSTLLDACCKVAPKAVYSTSSHMTGPGLTASVRQVQGRSAVEAGTLVLADGGVCCIDEIDKAVKIHSDLLDAMERQKVSIIKMGARVNLPTRTTVLAAGNPTNYVYDRLKSVSENLKMHPALLSRFDLVFIMTQQNDAIYERLCTQNKNNSSNRSSGIGSMNSNNSSLVIQSSLNLYAKLKLRTGEQMDRLPSLLFQNYIGYAKNNCFPKIGDQAAAKIEAFYMSLRMLETHSISFTRRQHEALCRLAIARARIDLAGEVTLRHVDEIIEITKYSLLHLFYSEDGQLDLSRGIQGSGMSKRNQKMAFYEKLCHIRDQEGQDIFTMDRMKAVWQSMNRTCATYEELYKIIDSLNCQCFLIMKDSRTYLLR